MNKLRSFYNTGTNLIYLLILILVLVTVVFWHNNPFMDMSPALLLITGAGAAAMLSLLSYIVDRISFVRDNYRKIAFFLLIPYFAVIVVMALKMQIVPRMNGWDFQIVARCAIDWRNGIRELPAYFSMWGNNTPLLWIQAAFFKLMNTVGVTDYMSRLVILNCVLITLSVLFTFLSADLLFKGPAALTAALIAMVYPGLFLYGAIAYTDTFSLFFVSLALLFYTKARDSYEKNKSDTHWLVLFTAAVICGAVIKITVLILLIACSIDYIFTRSKKRIAHVLLGIAGVALTFILTDIAKRPARMERRPEIPFTHWIMMGLEGDGGYNDDDYQLVLSVPRERRARFTRQEIMRRIEAKGLDGMAEHLKRKLGYIMSDGACYAPSKLDRGALRPHFIHEFIVETGRFSKVLYVFSDRLQLALIFFEALGTVREIRKQGRFSYIRLARTGIILFLLIWEARSRYLVNFLPLFFLSAGSGIPFIKHKEEER